MLNSSRPGRPSILSNLSSNCWNPSIQYHRWDISAPVQDGFACVRVWLRTDSRVSGFGFFGFGFWVAGCSMRVSTPGARRERQEQHGMPPGGSCGAPVGCPGLPRPASVVAPTPARRESGRPQGSPLRGSRPSAVGFPAPIRSRSSAAARFEREIEGVSPLGRIGPVQDGFACVRVWHVSGFGTALSPAC